MANVTLYGLFVGADLTANQPWSWTVTNALANNLTFWNQQLFQQMSLHGDFTIGAGGVVTGTVTQISLAGPEYATNVYSIDNLSADAAKVVDLITKGTGPQPFYSYLLGGDDTINNLGQVAALTGFGGNDTINGGPLNDLILADAGNDKIDGGKGIDAVKYSGKLADYTIDHASGTLTVTSLNGDTGTDTLSSIERIYFADKMLLPVDVNGPTGEISRLYRAALDRTPDANGLNYWTAQMEKGVTLDTLADAFIKSSEYQGLYGAGMSSTDLVEKYYEHILQRAPEQAGLDFWAGVLDKHTATTAEVLAAISESPEHVQISVALIGNGIVTDLPVQTI